MSKDELKKVAEAKISKKIKRGEILFKEGQKLDGVFCVRRGVSKLSKLSSNGKNHIVKLANKGFIIGQRSIVADETSNLTAVAVCDMEICFIPKSVIAETLSTNPNFALEVLRHLAHDLKEADNVIVNMSHKTVRQRMAGAFLYIKENYGEDTEGFLNLTLSREDYANVVGTATESCIRIISEFKKLGLLKTSGKKIGLTDERKLTAMVEGF